MTMQRTLIVAKMDAANADAVAALFAKSDASELPHLIGASRRTLFRFHDLYFHLVEAGEDITDGLYKARSTELYKELNTGLSEFISPYDPNWREPKDAMATPFYHWEA
ncbi:TcmI family type II polyketide cyclase [Nonomuraea sp. NPDC050394]